MGKLEGQVAIVTGGARGIGAEIVRTFVGEGAAVDVYDLTSAAPDDFPDDRVRLREVDIANAQRVEQAVAETVERHGRLDILVNAAGIAEGVPFLAMTPEQFDHILDVDLRGVFLTCRYAAPHMVEARSGRIINFSSQVALKGDVGLAHYVAAKAGVIGLTKALARELAPCGVLVNAIAPGPIETAMMDAMSEDFKEGKRLGLPLGRFGRPAEVAPTALLLASSPGGDIYVGQTLGPNSGDVMP